MIEIGDAVPLTFRVTAAGAPATATVALTVTRPDGTTATVNPTASAVGEYAAVFVPTQPGRHVLRWTATGGPAGSDSSQSDAINVVGSDEFVALVSLAEMKKHLNMETDVDDEELRGFIAAASLIVERFTHLIWARRVLTEEVTPDSSGTAMLDAAPLVEVLSAASLDGSTSYTASVVDAEHGIISVQGNGAVRVTLRAGPAVVPEHVQLAVKIIAEHLWETQRLGRIVMTDGEAAPTPGRGYLIPNRAAQLLGGPAPNRP